MSRFTSRRVNEITVFFAACLMILSACLLCYADVEVVNYTTSNFNVQIEANADNTMNYKESIVIDYSDVCKEFVRKLPESMTGRIYNLEVEGYSYEFDRKTNTVSIDMSSNSEPGKKSFSIVYSVKGTEAAAGEKEILYVPIIPSDWPTAVDRSKISFKYDRDLKWDSIKYVVGKSSARMTAYGDWSDSKNGNIISFDGEDIPANTGISITAVFPAGFWNYIGTIDDYKLYAKLLIAAGILIFVILRIAFGKAPSIDLIPNRYSIEGYSPAHIGYIVDGFIDNIDITATVIEMARKGYFNIIEYEKGEYSFEYVRFPMKENKLIKDLFNGIFGSSSGHENVKLNEIRKSLAAIVTGASAEAEKAFRGGKAAITSASTTANSIIIFAYMFVVAVIPWMNAKCITGDTTRHATALCIGVIIAGVMLLLIKKLCFFYEKMKSRKGDGNSLRFKIYSTVYVIASIAYSYVFSFRFNHSVGLLSIMFLTLTFMIISPLMLFGMKGRGKEIVQVLGKLEGLKQWIVNGDKQEFKELSAEREDYFFELLPYAMVFNITKKLIRDFEYVDIVAPEWYRPYGVDEDYTFDVVILNSMMTRFNGAMQNNVYAISDRDREAGI